MRAGLGTLLAITMALPLAIAGGIPGPAAHLVFLFGSPNTQESLSDEDAKARLTSFEQRNAAAVADRAACALTHSVEIADALGIYDQSSENSFVLEADLEPKASEYLAALLGLYSRQEFLLLFFDERGGGDRLWLIQTPQSLDSITVTLRKLQLTPVTVRAEKPLNDVWFVDIGQKHAAALDRFAKEVSGRVSLIPGRAEMLGNPRRDTAVQVWRRQIRAFEQQSGRHLSAQLSSNVWRNATVVHTCSRDL